jgi:tetratricopeptide (TPR) repeat protein
MRFPNLSLAAVILKGIIALSFLIVLRSTGVALPLSQSNPARDAASSPTVQRSQTASPLPALERAQDLISHEKLDEARSLLLHVLKTYPHEAALHNFLGVVDAQQGREPAAEQNFKRAIRESPHYAGAYLNLGHLYQVEAGKNPEVRTKAIAIYRALLRFDPGNAEANYQYAVLQLQEGSYKDSLDHLLRLPSADQNLPRVLALFCADHAGLGELDLADSDANRLLSSPDLREADVLPILAVLQAHSTGLAIRLVEGLVKRQRASPSTFQQLGKLYEQTGQFERARSILEEAARGQPQSAAPLIELARLANQQHDYRGALGYLAHARELEPQNAAIHFFFGMVCVELDLHQEAYASLKKAVALDPQNPYYNYALGAVCTQREDAREAIGYFQKYCQLRPHDPRGILALGEAYFYSHDLGSAGRELKKVASNPTTAATAHYFLGRIASDENRWTEAISDFQTALSYHPQYADAYAGLGRVYLTQRKYIQAEEALQRAVQIEPDNYTANLNLMVVYERTKDKRAAAQAQRFTEIKKQRSERAKMFLRTIRIVP